MTVPRRTVTVPVTASVTQEEVTVTVIMKSVSQ